MGRAERRGDLLATLGREVQQRFVDNNRVLSFAEYFSLVKADPRWHLRSAAQYLCDALDYYGTRQVPHPAGDIRRFCLFDAPWADGKGQLRGQEEAQNEIYRTLKNFARQGVSTA